MQKQVISFSLYGDRPLYTAGAVRNAELVRTIYPGWVARFYVAADVPRDVVAALRERDAELVDADPALDPMFVRNLVAADPAVARFVIRDADSRLNVREKAAVDAWIASARRFHLMRDSIHHRPVMLGGMWGGPGGAFPQMREMIEAWGAGHAPGRNDEFCGEVLFPLIAGDYLCHDSWGEYHADGRPFPPHPPMAETSYVGEIVRLDFAGMDVWRKLGEMDNEVCRAQWRLQPVAAEAARLRDERDRLAADLASANAAAAGLERTVKALGGEKAAADRAAAAARAEAATLAAGIAAAEERIAKLVRRRQKLADARDRLVRDLAFDNGPPELRAGLRLARLLRTLGRRFRVSPPGRDRSASSGA